MPSTVWFMSITRGDTVCLRANSWRKIGGPLRRFPDFQQMGVKGLVRSGISHGQLRMAQDHAQHVIEIVGDPAGQPSHGFHLLGLVQPLLQLLLLQLGLLAQAAGWRCGIHERIRRGCRLRHGICR